MAKIVVVGSASIDLTVIADKRPNAGETVIGQQLMLSAGGKGANQAVAAARLGANVTFVGCVANDSYGNDIIENFKQNNVNIEHLARVENTTTGTAHIILAEGDNSIVVVPGANLNVSRQIIDNARDEILNADIVMVQQEIPLDSIAYLGELCHSYQIQLLLNPAPIQATPSSVIANAAFITPNEHEANAIFPTMNLTQALQNNPHKLIVTQGSAGALYHDGQEIVTVDGFKVQAVDTTGAGDTFNAAFAVAIAEKKSFAESIKFANAAAALSVQKLGAQGGMPSRTEVEEFLG